MSSENIMLKAEGTARVPEEAGRKKRRQIFQQGKSKANIETDEVTDNCMNVNEHEAI